MANGIAATGSVLAGVRPQAQPDLAGSLLGGVQGRQNVLAGQQMAEQRQFNIDQAPQVAERQAAESEQRQQINQQQIGEADFNMAVQRARVENRLARQIRDLPLGERERFKQSLDPGMLQSLGIDPQQVAQAGTSDQALDDIIRQTEAALSAAGQGQATASQRERQSLMQDLEGGIDPQTGQLKPEDQLTARQRNAAVELNLLARPGTTTSRERIAEDPETTERVANSEAEIRKAVKAAEVQAKEEGEILSEYERAQAAMPGLTEVVDKLKTLSDVATYTMGGKAFDTVMRELGFGATEGSTARAKMEALVNNQILPLLRDTFGAQFTEREGEQLRRTMLDIDAAPEQKKEILNAFIEQKMRDLEMNRGRAESLDSGPPPERTVNWGDLP